MTKKPPKAYRCTRFTVEGDDQFPPDMLRYDCCIPDTSEDARKIADSLMESRDPKTARTLRRVTLRMFSEEAYPPCDARWRSFGWEVVPDELDGKPLHIQRHGKEVMR